MNATDKALALQKEGFSCSQAVLAAFCNQFGVDKNIALKIGSSFGGGMHLNQTCGAVTGALMVIGLKHGRIKADDIAAKMKNIEVATKFAKKFKERHKTLSCAELLGCDISTPAGLQKAKDNNLIKQFCPDYVKSACEILEELL
ncbi:MAG: C-GCAxxG-C-C family protein [Planctomycetaceae bacterium]|nr:C-GCAxxG-C-C family protein [Planctomycetaceae bacterium]